MIRIHVDSVSRMDLIVLSHMAIMIYDHLSMTLKKFRHWKTLIRIDPNSSSNGPNILDKERNLMNEDPKWQDTNYVLGNYKTEPCKRPPRLCRQGYACPQYHNSKDKRRSPRKYKYR